MVELQRDIETAVSACVEVTEAPLLVGASAVGSPA
jgi:hypothetical protein